MLFTVLEKRVTGALDGVGGQCEARLPACLLKVLTLRLMI